MEFDIIEYRNARDRVELASGALDIAQKAFKESRDEQVEIEQKVFEQLETGDGLDLDEFQFITKPGRKNLYPPKGFEEHLEETYGKKISDEITTMTITIKPKTLTFINEWMDGRGLPSPERESLLNSLGYKEGDRIEQVKVKDQ